MRRLLILCLAVATMLALAAPASAATKVRQAEGTTTFTVVATCNSGGAGDVEGQPDCAFDGETLEITITNPGTKRGSFNGAQVFDGVVNLNVVDLSFTISGTVVFDGRVRGCGSGTVVFEASGAGSIDPATGLATFDSNEQVIVGGTLPIRGHVSEVGTESPNGDGTSSLDYTGAYVCKRSRA